MSDPVPIAELRRVSFSWPGEPPLLREVSLAIGAGDRIGLAGPIGAGKSTLLQLFVGLRRPTAGEVLVFGKPVRRESDFRAVRPRIGLVFQDPDDQLFCPTVLEDVMFGPLHQGLAESVARDRAAQTLATLGLDRLAERPIHRLSHGQKRLVSLAGVLALNPDLLLLDEPTNGLDDESADRLLAILDGSPAARLVVSHDRTWLARLTERRLRLIDGVIRDE
jgi:cobalt/nickel transport system ATP-binding protein